ncbi:uncharacterized protein RSE6_04218 [Rhynchosporium secalis]|uniref:Uncharacterized protein n=1 Tax=Rhynchosporium secalis TaxID=38038 RepID=A0A1E1M4P9_RHYSE|nr:uncharacterized protein RSE6_04218 [Rhynchosporium secalis]
MKTQFYVANAVAGWNFAKGMLKVAHKYLQDSRGFFLLRTPPRNPIHIPPEYPLFPTSLPPKQLPNLLWFFFRALPPTYVADTTTAPLAAPAPLLSPSSASGRPGTSGTELNLRSDRQKAQTSYQRAAEAEQAYRAKRRATYARKDMTAAKEHFKVAGTSIKEGTKCVISAVRAGPAILKEKQVKMREESKQKKKENAEAVSFLFLSVSGLPMRFCPRFYLLFALFLMVGWDSSWGFPRICSSPLSCFESAKQKKWEEKAKKSNESSGSEEAAPAAAEATPAA